MDPKAKSLKTSSTSTGILPDEILTKILSIIVGVKPLSVVAVKPLLRFRAVSKPWCSVIDGPQFVKMHLSSVFPQDIMSIILSGVAVNHLLRFRSVSKPWCSLIESNAFVKMQSVSSKCSLILRSPGQDDACSFPISSAETADYSRILRPPFNCEFFKSNVATNCNGLVVAYYLEGEKLLTYVWNPFTTKLWNLPDLECKEEEDMHREVTLGLAYVSENDEYNVVLVTQYSSYTCKSCGMLDAQMFSSIKKEWENLRQFPAGFESFVHLDGKLSFVCYPDESSWNLKSFDTKTKIHHTLPKPSGFDDFVSSNIILDVVEGNLCLLMKKVDSADILVLKEQSWERLWALDSTGLKLNIPITSYGAEFLLVLNRPDDIIEWYNPISKKVRKVRLETYPSKSYRSWVEVWSESLVSFFRDDEEGKRR